MHSRRTFVTGCGAVLASAGLSGCNVLDSGGGGGSPSAYTDWSYEADADVATFSYLQYAEVASVEELPEGFVDEEVLGIPIEEFDHEVRFQSHSVFEGSFDASEFRTGLEEEQGWTLEEDGEQSGYQFYGVSDQSMRIGLQDGRAVIGPSEEIGTFLDAGAGEVESLADVNDDFDELTSELGTGHSVSGRVKLSGDAQSFAMGETEVARGSTTQYGSDVTEATEVVLFETADDVDEESARSNYEDRDEISDLSSSVDGRAVTLTFTVQTDDLG